MNKNDFTTSSKYEIGRTWEIPRVKAIPESQTVNEVADDHFRPCILRPDPAHSFTAFRRCEGVPSSSPLQRSSSMVSSARITLVVPPVYG